MFSFFLLFSWKRLKFFKVRLKSFKLNFGPQHPAAHGVLRLILTLDCERILNVDTHIGLLHRGTEKLLEYKTSLQGLPYFDRLDYVSMMAQEHCFSLSIERALNIRVPLRASLIRIILIELTRILNHLLALTTHALDVGAVTPFLWAFEEREKLFEFYERISGARMHANFIRPGGLLFDLQQSLLNDLFQFLLQFLSRCYEIEDLLLENRVWNLRLRNIGILHKKMAVSFNFSGVMLRSSGVSWDLRKNLPYEGYFFIPFQVPIGFVGDSFERFVQRIEEMKQASFIMLFCLNNLCSGEVKIFNSRLDSVLKRSDFKLDMASLIEHFLLFSLGQEAGNYSSSYTAVEAPKGEFGVFLATNLSSKPARCHIKAPGFFHLQGLNTMSKYNLLADLVTLIGTQDLVLGEIDR